MCSSYNLLLHEERVVVINVVNVCAWFAARGVEVDVEEVFGDVIAEAW